MKGTAVVEENYRFPIVDVELREGRFWFQCHMDGPLDALPAIPRQYVIYGSDGQEIFHARVGQVGWPDVPSDGFLLLGLSLSIDEAHGTGGPW